MHPAALEAKWYLWCRTPEASKRARQARQGADVLEIEHRDLASFLGAVALEDFLDAVPDAVLIADQAGRIEAVNHHLAALFGYSPGELRGQRVELLMPPRARASHEKNRETFAQQPRRRPMASGTELHGLRKDGSEFPAEISLAPIRTPAGIMVTAAIRDVTERRRALERRAELERRLQHAQRAESLAVLAGGVAHDFNNLLVGIVGNVGLALRAIPPDSALRELLSDMEAAAQRATGLARQMLAFSGKGKFLVERIDLNAVIERTMASEDYASRRGAIRAELATGLPRVDADATQMEQVIRALVANAFEAIGPESGEVRIMTQVLEVRDGSSEASAALPQALDPGLYVSLQIRDNGCGMDESTRERMFEPFFTTKFPGRGLELAAVMGIVRGHHGAIRVSSGLGEGTSVEVLLPVAQAEVESRTSLHTAVCNQDKKILVVDDDSHVRRTVRSMLLTLGFTSILTATDGRDALEVYRANQASIRAVILDVTMPRMGGLETLDALRSMDRRLQVLMMSGYADHHALLGPKRTNVRGFLQKPFSLEQLSAALASIEALQS